MWDAIYARKSTPNRPSTTVIQFQNAMRKERNYAICVGMMFQDSVEGRVVLEPKRRSGRQ
jgi:hypothetical protein